MPLSFIGSVMLYQKISCQLHIIKPKSFFSGLADTNTSSYSHGICCRWWAFWEDMQCGEIQRGWGRNILTLSSFLFTWYISKASIWFNCGLSNLKQARFFFQQLISGVSYCHSMVFICVCPVLVKLHILFHVLIALWFLTWQQICHRDLKLENTLLDGSTAPRLKICDFGYSKVINCCKARN